MNQTQVIEEMAIKPAWLRFCYGDEFAAKRSTALSTAPETKLKGRIHPKELSLKGKPGRQTTEETQSRKLA